MKRVVQCLYHTSHLAITYFRDGNVFSSEKNTATVWEAGCYPLDWNKDDVTDASFGDESVTRRSSSGELIYLFEWWTDFIVLTTSEVCCFKHCKV